MAAVTICGVCGKYEFAEEVEYIVPKGETHYVVACPACAAKTPHG